MSRSAAAIQTALAQLNANQNEQAKVTLRRILQKDPGDPEANKLMGMVLAGQHQHEQALFFLKRAIQSAPNEPQLWFLLGNLYLFMRRDKEGAEAYREAARLSPTHLRAYDGLAKCLLRAGDHAGGVAAYEAGIAAAPDEPVAYRAMASALSTMGRVPEGIAALRRGIARLPEDPGLRESLCYQINFSDDLSPREIYEEHAALGRLVQRTPRRPAPALFNSKDPSRRLRVGIVSGDFCDHPCGIFMEGPLRELDRGQFELFLYYVRAEVEEPTRRFAALAGPGWRHMPGAPSEAVAAQVVHDRIDILIDAMGWTELQRMAVFEPRSAPVQMTWLGYPNTTGLPSMDYRIVDEFTDPPGSEALCTEKLLRLPGCFVCYQPEADAPEPQMTRALSEPASGEPITFGSFNRLSKVRPATARTWGAILSAVPGSRLMLKSSLVSEDVKAEYLREFAAAGVGPERLVWSSYVFGPKAHLSMYHQVDIALDSFPYNGTTTTCEATWMGVPVVTLTGQTHRERVGTSLLTALGLPELIAPTREKYIEIAADLAKDRSRLAEYHRTLRGRMASSGLCDAKGFARKLETTLRDAWRTWCVSP